MTTKKISGASGATLETRKWLKLRTLFCAASYNIRKGFPSSPRGTFRGLSGRLSHPTFNHPSGGWKKREGLEIPLIVVSPLGSLEPPRPQALPSLFFHPSVARLEETPIFPSSPATFGMVPLRIILNQSTRDSYTRCYGYTDRAYLRVLPVCQCCVA